MSKDTLFKKNELFPVPKEAELLVTRNTKGNQLPGYTQRMTLKEAIKYGAWDTSHGTMECYVTLIDSDKYDPPIHKSVFLFRGTPVVMLKREWEED